MADLTKFNEFMKQFLPLLLRGQMDEKRVKLYLDKALKEMEARGEIRGEEAKKEFMRKIMLQLIETGQQGVEGLDRPLLALLERLPGAGVTDPSIPTLAPGVYGRATAPFEETQALLTERLEGKQYPSEVEIANATRVFGSDKVTEMLKELEKKSIGEARLKEEGVGHKLQEERLDLDRERFEQSKLEFTLTGGGKGKINEQDLALYSLLSKEETTLNSELRGLKEEWEDEIDEGKKKAIEAKLDKVREQKLALVDRMLKTQLSTERLNGIIQKLKSNNSTVAGIEANKEKFMADLGLTDVEYDYIIFRIEK